MTPSRRPAPSAARSRRWRRRRPSPTWRQVRERTAGVAESEGIGDGVLFEMVLATSCSTARRCARRWTSRACSPERRARAGRVRAGRGMAARSRPGRFQMGAGAGRLRLRQRAPAPRARARRVRDRAPAGHQRELAAASARAAATSGASGGRTRAGPGSRSTTSPTIRPSPRADRDAPACHVCWFEADAFARAHDARLPTEQEWERAATWSGRRRGALGAVRPGVGVDRHAASPATRASRRTPTGSTPRSSSAAATACCAAARGRPTRASRRRRSATGICRCAGRSSPACGWRGSADWSDRRQPAADEPADHDRLAPARRPRALARRRRARRPHAPLQGAAAEALLRRARRRSCSTRSASCRSTTRRAPSARSSRTRADELAATTGAVELVELGSGTAAKTRVLLDALHGRRHADALRAGRRHRERWSANARRQLTGEYPGLRVHGVIGDFERHLEQVPARRGPRIVAFLGGTIGNFPPGEPPALPARRSRGCSDPRTTC